jgi:peptidoglycan-associated lipoprotein
MSGKLRFSKPVTLLGTLALLAGFSGCSFVKKQDLDDQLSTMRAEMEADRQAEIAEGDQRVSQELNGRMDGLSSRMDGLERALQSLSEDFNARVSELEDAIRFDAPVYFAFDEDEVGPEYQAYLDRFAEIVTEYYPLSLITVEGFTDPVGTPEYNMALGERRAESVKAYLVDYAGLGADRVRTVSYGEATDRLVASDRHGPGQEGWENRRVVLVIDHSGA